GLADVVDVVVLDPRVGPEEPDPVRVRGRTPPRPADVVVAHHAARTGEQDAGAVRVLHGVLLDHRARARRAADAVVGGTPDVVVADGDVGALGLDPVAARGVEALHHDVVRLDAHAGEGRAVGHQLDRRLRAAGAIQAQGGPLDVLPEDAQPLARPGRVESPL